MYILNCTVTLTVLSSRQWLKVLNPCVKKQTFLLMVFPYVVYAYVTSPVLSLKVLSRGRDTAFIARNSQTLVTINNTEKNCEAI